MQPETVLLIIYLAITGILFVRFLFNLSVMIKWIAGNQKIRKKDFTIVLTEKGVMPFSFLNFMFVSKQEYENDFLNGCIFRHELAHIRQKHSLDVLFAEILKIVFWFNPFIYLYKKQIQLNHEFLADYEVLSLNSETVRYKKLLIQKMAVQSNTLSSSFSYLSTKKRLIMMSKNTSKTKKRMLQTLSFPLLVFSIMLFSQPSQAQQTNENKGATQKEIRQYNRAVKKVNKKNSKPQKNTNLKQAEIDRLNAVYEKMSPEQKAAVKAPGSLTSVVPLPPPVVRNESFDSAEFDEQKAKEFLAQAEKYYKAAQPYYNQAMVYYNDAMPYYNKAQEFYKEGQPFYEKAQNIYENAQVYYSAAMKFQSEMKKLKSENKVQELQSVQNKYEEKMNLYISEMDKYGAEMDKYTFWMEKYGSEMDKYGAEMDKYAFWMEKYGSEMGKYGIEMDKYGKEIMKKYS